MNKSHTMCNYSCISNSVLNTYHYNVGPSTFTVIHTWSLQENADQMACVVMEMRFRYKQNKMFPW